MKQQHQQQKQQKQQQKVICEEIENNEIKQQFMKLCTEYDDIIAKNWSDVGKIEGVTLKLELKPGSTPTTRKAPRRHNKVTQEQWEQQRPLLEEAGFITRSDSEYSHDLYYIPKKKEQGVIEL